MIKQLLNIAANTFIEAIRQPIFIVLLTAGWLLQALGVTLSGYTMGLTDSAEVTKDNKMLLDMGLATVFVCATLLAALICTSVVSREIENKTALTVISKPIGRPVFVLGKYLGATAAVLLAGTLLSIFFILALRQGVMTTARDKADIPVIIFGLGSVVLSMGLASWCNFFYGWVFSSTSVLFLTPLLLLGWFGTMILGKGWTVQPIGTDWKPDVMKTVISVLLAMPVLSAVALAASTRLGQVMTITVCVGVFMGGLLSNHLIGRRAIMNSPVARVEAVEAERDNDSDFADAADRWRLTFELSPEQSLQAGQSVYYGPSPNGLGIVVPPHEAFAGDPTSDNALLEASSPAVLVRAMDGERLDQIIVVNAGGLAVSRPPQVGDYLFLQPTAYNPVALGAWGVVPNMQFFWLVDAVTQAHEIPMSYVRKTALYALLQVIALNGLAVLLFQRREVG